MSPTPPWLMTLVGETNGYAFGVATELFAHGIKLASLAMLVFAVPIVIGTVAAGTSSTGRRDLLEVSPF